MVDRSWLRRVPALERLDEDELQSLIRGSSRHSYASEEIVFEEGDACAGLFLVLSGSLRIIGTDARSGQELVLASLETGDYFGEQSLLPGGVDKTDGRAVATAPTDLLCIKAEAYKAVARPDEHLVEEIKRLGAGHICQRLMRELGEFRWQSLVAGSDRWLREKDFADGEIVYRAGDPGEDFYMVLNGVAQVVQHKGSREQVVARLGVGNHFGEGALIRQETRIFTVRAEGPLRVASLNGPRFLALYANTLELRGLLQRFRGHCMLSGKGVVTLHSGQFLDMESVTSVYHFPDGAKITATKVTGRPIFSMRHLDRIHGGTRSLVFEDAAQGIYRELTLSGRRLATVTAVGRWADLGRIVECISQGRHLWPWQLALFSAQGELWLEREAESFADSAVICKCTGVSRGVLNEAVRDGCDTVEALAERTGASRICGSCTPLLAGIVGRSDMQPVELVGILPVTPQVKSFRFRPRQGPVHAFAPGQHFGIEACIDGRWVHRSYTLTSPDQAPYYEITVKREPHGLFSRWLHDRITTDALVRVSPPRGDFCLPLDAPKPAVFLAGGIGITPALAMTRKLMQVDGGPVLHIDYSAPATGQLAFVHELTEAATARDNISVRLRATQREGRVGTAAVLDLVQRYPDARYYVCGPKPFEQTVCAHLESCGVGTERVNTERFVPLAGGTAAIASVKHANALLAGSLLVLLLGLAFLFAHPFASPTSAQQGLGLEFLWTDAAWKQASGYSLLALVLSGMGLSLRKRWRRVRFGDFATWRLFHLAAGLLSLLLLVAHTGFHLGQNFNLLLIGLFLGVTAVGSISAVLTVLENRWPNTVIHRLNSGMNSLHLVASWPLPVLVGIHILSAYYF